MKEKSASQFDRKLTPIKENLGDWFTSARVKLQLSVRQLAEDASISFTTINRLLNGYRVPSEKTVLTVAYSLGLEESEAFERLNQATNEIASKGGLDAYPVVKGTRMARRANVPNIIDDL